MKTQSITEYRALEIANNSEIDSAKIWIVDLLVKRLPRRLLSGTLIFAVNSAIEESMIFDTELEDEIYGFLDLYDYTEAEKDEIIRAVSPDYDKENRI
jgi:hypothetical protein